jgi:SMC interacting uncharacterized protein involved in chromosome segregation
MCATALHTLQAFFDFLGNAYRCFLDGDDAGYAALESDLVGSFEHQNSLIAADVQQLQERNAALRSETAAVLSRARALPELQARQKDFKSDLEKFQVRTCTLSVLAVVAVALVLTVIVIEDVLTTS